jgi:hypothetical protein
MEAVWSSKTPMSIYETTWHHNPDDNNMAQFYPESGGSMFLQNPDYNMDIFLDWQHVNTVNHHYSSYS